MAGYGFRDDGPAPWAGDPRPLWKVWDEFGIAESEMVGWWVDANPVKTDNRDVLATCYVRSGKGGKSPALVSLPGTGR